MKIIGVFGGSGTGKSTASKMISSKIKNSIIINVDKYMHEELENQKDLILDTLEIEGTDRNKYICNHTVQSLEVSIITIGIIEEKVYSKVLKDIESFRNKYKYIILDWYAIPLTRLYNICDYTVCVYADYDKRLKRLTERLKDSNIYGYGDRSYWSYEQDAIEKRVTITALNDYGYIADFLIENNSNIADMEEKVNNIVKNIEDKICNNL
ncbi:MAG: dephospho-CoA kinase [Clostridia bacterium]|nr:dephospho-CoA kinase [Clostridia bacterium]